MKKLVVLALLLTVGMLWAQQPWSDVHKMDLGVTLDYMWSQDFGAGKTFSDRPILELKFNWVADDFTTVYVELEEGPMNSQGDTTGVTAGQGGYGRSGKANINADKGYDVKIVGLDKAYFTTDVGKFFKLPVSVVVMYGYNEWNNKDNIRVTKSEYEDFLGEADIRTWGGQIEFSPSPAITIRSNWAWNSGAVDPLLVGTDVLVPASWVGAKSEPLYMIGAYGTVAPVSYEITYFSNDNEVGKGWVEGGVKFAQDLTKDLNVAAMVALEYDLQDDPYPAYGWLGAPNAAYMLQAGAQVMFQKFAGLGVSYRGAEDMMAGAVQVQAYFTPKAGDPLEVLAQAGFGLDSDMFDSTFDSLEIALRYTMGKVQWYLGFWYAAEFSRGVAKEWQDFDLADIPLGDGGANIFMRGRVAL